ncbi:MAG: non-canonical purine NTP pyrophosphatase [Hymenobacter sp.]
MRLCFASNNAHKLDEIRLLLPHVELLSLADIGCHEELRNPAYSRGQRPPEGQYVWDHYGVACFADDTGLEVNALGGAPGVYSARYAGPAREAAANIARLLRGLGSAPDRQARFRTVIALVRGPGDAHEFSGEVMGTIAAAPIGRATFGYDPIFVPDEGDGRTFAEMTLHREKPAQPPRPRRGRAGFCI